MEMTNLVVMDFTTGSIHHYKVPSDLNVDEEVIEALGHKAVNCYYMTGDTISFTEHSKPVTHQQIKDYYDVR